MHFTTLRRVFASRSTLILFCLSLGAVSTSVSAATFTVNSSDDNNDGLCDSSHCSLREAINTLNAAGGGIIRFDSMVFPRSGTAAPAIVPQSNLPRIMASRSTVDGSGARVVLDGTVAPGTGLIFESGAGSGGALDRVTIRAIAVKNFTFDGILVCGGSVGNSCDGPVSRALIEGSSSTDSGTGIKIKGSAIDRSAVRDSVAVGNAEFGIWIDSDGDMKRTSVTGSTARDNPTGGIVVSVDTGIVGLKLAGNVATDNGGPGLSVVGSGSFRAVSFIGNTAAGNSSYGIGMTLFAGDLLTPKLLNNVTSSNQFGLFLTANSGDIVKAQLKGNVSTGNSSYGILFQSGGETSRANLRANSATGNGDAGIRLKGTRGLIVGNTASGNQRGIVLYGNATNNRIERNLTHGNSIVGVVTESGSIGNKLSRNEGRGNGDDDFYDANADCGTNAWRKNQFGSANLDCIQ